MHQRSSWEESGTSASGQEGKARCILAHERQQTPIVCSSGGSRRSKACYELAENKGAKCAVSRFILVLQLVYYPDAVAVGPGASKATAVSAPRASLGFGLGLKQSQPIAPFVG